MKRIINWFNIAVCGSLLFAAAGCTDDHYEAYSGDAASTNVWELLSQNPNLSEFTNLVSQVKITRNDIVTDQTYAEYLSEDGAYTIFAPANGSFDAAEWNTKLQTMGNEFVEREFVKNYITQLRYPTSVLQTPYAKDGVVKLTLLNTKPVDFKLDDNGAVTFNNILLDKTYRNITASNGVLHMIGGQNEYFYNLQEYLDNYKDFNLNRLHEAIYKYGDPEKKEPVTSTAGPTLNGMTYYHDSTVVKPSYFYTSWRDHLDQEDSLTAVVFPTDQAWDEALPKLKRFFQYRKTYTQNYKELDRNTNKWVSKNFTIEIDPDSLRDLKAAEALMKPTVFNARTQFDEALKVDFNDWKDMADSIKTTRGHKMFKYINNKLAVAKTGQEAQKLVDDVKNAFDGEAPLQASNGWAYFVKKWNYRPTDVVLEGVSTTNYECYENTSTDPDNNRIDTTAMNPYVKGNAREYITIGGKMGTTQKASPIANMTFKINGLRSGKYNVFAVVVPNCINDENIDNAKPNRFFAQMVYYADPLKETPDTAYSMITGNYQRDETKITSEKNQLGCTDIDALKEDYKKGNDITPVGNDYRKLVITKSEDEQYVLMDTVMLFRDYELPISYYETYGDETPYMTLTLYNMYRHNRNTMAQLTKGLDPTLRIAAIIFRPTFTNDEEYDQ